MSYYIWFGTYFSYLELSISEILDKAKRITTGFWKPQLPTEGRSVKEVIPLWLPISPCDISAFQLMPQLARPQKGREFEESNYQKQGRRVGK